MHIGRKLNVHRMLRRPGYLLKVLCTFNLRPVPRGRDIKKTTDQSAFYQFFQKNLKKKWKSSVDKGKVFGTMTFKKRLFVK